MYFRTISAGIVSLLGAAASGQYRVVGYQEQDVASDEIRNTERLVQVRYKRGEFPRSGSGRGPIAHHMDFEIMLTVSSAAGVDLTILENPASTPTQIATALAASESASKRVNDSMDELFDLVYQVLMSGPNIDLGLGFRIGSRWVPDFEKGDVYNRGEHAVLTGMLRVSCQIDESVPSATLYQFDDNDVSLTFEGDATERAGVKEAP